MAGLHFDITGDNSNFMRKLDEARNGVRTTSKQIEESGVSIEQMFGRLTKGAAAFGAGFTAKELISNVVRVRGEFQQLEVAFNTMLGSEDKATTLMSQLVKTAATTPFDLQSVANGAKQLLAYGTSAEAVNGTLVQLGDIAAGLSIPLNDLVWLYGTTMTQGRLFTNDFRQFQSRGIPLADELAKQFGVTKDKVGELVTAGKVGFPEVQKAIVAMTSEGGKFGGLMAAQSRTITGQISNIEDSFSTMYNNIGKQSEGFINDALSGVSYLVANYEQVGKVILELAATYGVYKAVLMSVAAYQSMAVGVTYAAEIAELSKLIPLKQQSANQDVIAAVASGKLTQSKAEQVIALRAEIAAKMQSLQATEAQTKVEYASAMASYKSATQRMLLAKQNMAIAQSQMSIAIKSGTVEEIAAAKKNAQTASLELNNAAVAKNTAHKGVNIAATNSKSASEALNTLETGLNTVAQNTNTTSTNILTVAKTKLAAASKALGLSMLANPYVLAAAAVAGLGYAIYKTATAETELDKAHQRLNDATSDVEKGLASEVSKLTSLERKLAETKKGTEEYNNIKKTIVDNYGKYYEGLDGEIERVGSLSTVYGQLVEAMRLSIGQRKFESFFKAEQDNLDKTIGEKLDTAYETLIDKYGKTKGGNLYNQFFDSAMHGEPLSPSAIKDLQNATFMNVKWGSNAKDGIIDFKNSVFDLRSEISKETKATEEVLDDYKSKFQITEEEVAKILEGDSSSTNEQPKDNKTLKQLLLDIDASKSKIKELQEQANKGLISSDKIKEEQDVLSKLTSDYKNRTGLEYGSTKQESAAEKLRKQNEKSAEELFSIRRQNQQDEINLMKEGTEKKLKQIELDYQKELDTIKKQESDWSKAQKGKLTQEQTVEISTRYTNADKKKEKSIGDDTKERLLAEQQALNEYLTKYGTFQQQKLAIAQEYAEKIKKAQEENGANSTQVKLLQKEQSEKTSAIDAASIKANMDWVAVFGEFGGIFSDMIKPALEEAKKYIKTDGFKNSDQADQKVLIDAINQMEKSLGGSGGLNFKKLGQDVQIYQNSLRELNNAKEEEVNAINKLKKAQEEYEKAIKSGTEEEKNAAAQAVDTAQQNANTASANVSTQTNIANQSQQGLSDTAINLRANMNNVTEGLSKLASGGIKNAYDGLIQAGKGMGGAMEKVADSLEDVPIIGWIVSIIDVFKDGLSNLVGGLLDAIFNAVSGIIGDVLSGDLFVTIGESLVTGISKILDAITFGGFGSWINAGESDETLKDDIELLSKSNEDLKEAIDNLAEKMDSASVADATDLYEQQKENLKEQLANTQEMMQRSGAAYSNGWIGIGGSHSSNAKINDAMSSNDWSRISAAIGKTVGSAGDFWNLTSEEMAKVAMDATDLYSKIKSYADDGYEDAGKYMDSYIEYYKQLEELENTWREKLTSASFDTIRDDFKSALMDMEADTEDFASSFEELMKNAIFESLMTEKYDLLLRDWYKEFATSMDGGKLTKEEQAALKNGWDDIVNQGIEERDALYDTMGWNKTTSSSSQDSTNGGFQTMSQDEGKELNGRFTAFQISNEEIKNAMLSMLISVNLISVSVSSNSITLIEIRNIMISSNSYLEDIAKYTKELIGLKQTIANIENSAKAMAGK